MLLLFETPAGYSLFKVKDENKLKDIDVRSSLLSRFFPFLFVCVSRPPPIGERAINDHHRRRFCRNSLSLSLSLEVVLPDRYPGRDDDDRLSLSHVSDGPRIDGGLGQRDVPARARASRRDLVCKLTPFFVLPLLDLFLHTLCRRWRNRSAPRIPPRKWSR